MAAVAPLLGVVWSIPAITVPIIAIILANHYPPLHDLATDLADPPQFKILHPVTNDDRMVAFQNVYTASEKAIIKEAYPGLAPRHYDMAYATLLEAIPTVIRELGWKEIMTPQPKSEGEGNRLEAETASPILGLRGGISICLREKNGKVTVDARAITFGLNHDFGIAHRQIHIFLNSLDRYLEKLEEP